MNHVYDVSTAGTAAAVIQAHPSYSICLKLKTQHPEKKA